MTVSKAHPTISCSRNAEKRSDYLTRVKRDTALRLREALTHTSWSFPGEIPTELTFITNVVLCCSCGNLASPRVSDILIGGSKGCTSCASRKKMANLCSARRARGEFYTEDELAISRRVRNAKSRCSNPNNKGYHNYGGRGIEFRFESIRDCVLYMIQELGPIPSGGWFDRIDNDGHYEPGNLRYVSPSLSRTNQREKSSPVYGARLKMLMVARPDYTYEGLRKFILQGCSDEYILAMVKPLGGRPRKT